MTNQDYKNAALAALKGKWAPAVLATIMIIVVMIPYYALYFGSLSIVGSEPADLIGAPASFWIVYAICMLYMLMVYVPFAGVGYANAFKQLLNTGDDRLTANSFKFAFTRWLRNFWGMFLMGLKEFLWTLLLIIPGIIKAFGYALTPYLLVDCPELTPLQCIKLSDRMMKGHKFDLFYLYLSFIGWFLLCILTLGIGFLWLQPYVSTSVAAFYKDVKEQYLAGIEGPAPAAPAPAEDTPVAEN